MANVSLFCTTRHLAIWPIADLLHRIRCGHDRGAVEEYRRLAFTGHEEEAIGLLFALPYFTPAGSFLGRRHPEALLCYSGLVMLETRPLPAARRPLVRQALAAQAGVAACFLNVAGNALVVLARAGGLAAGHRRSFCRLFVRLSAKASFGLLGASLADGCFLSYDPDAYFDPGACSDGVAIPVPPAGFPPLTYQNAQP